MGCNKPNGKGQSLAVNLHQLKEKYLSTPKLTPLSTAILLAVSTASQAATYTVTNSNDSGTGSLRQAVLEANRNSGEDEIVFDLKLAGKSIDISSVVLDITDALSITGPTNGNQNSIVISAKSTAGVISSTADLVLANVTLKGSLHQSGIVITAPAKKLVLNDSHVTENSTYGNGAGIRAESVDIIMNRSKVSSNFAQGHGGGIHVTNGNVTVNESLIAGNGSFGKGGGLSAPENQTAKISIQHSTIDDNYTNGDQGTGGGIYIKGGAFELKSSTVSNNSARELYSNGGGVALVDAVGNIDDSTFWGNSTLSFHSYAGGLFMHNSSMSLDQSTFSNNTSYWTGGAFTAFNSDVSIVNSTLTENRIENPTGRAFSGGIDVQAYYGNSTIDVQNSIIASNTGPLGNIRLTNSSGSLTVNVSNSIIGNSEKSSFSINGVNTNNIFTDDAGLGSLQDNGGPTLTHLPLDGSSAIDAGNGTFATGLLNDQRGNGYARLSGNAVDIGSVEKQSGVTPIKMSWDIDADGNTEALTDGLLVLRYLFNFTGETLVSGAVGSQAARNNYNDIYSHLETMNNKSILDIDGNGETLALTDGLLLLRYLFNFSGNSLIEGAIGANASRNTPEEVTSYLKTYMP